MITRAHMGEDHRYNPSGIYRFDSGRCQYCASRAPEYLRVVLKKGGRLGVDLRKGTTRRYVVIGPDGTKCGLWTPAHIKEADALARMFIIKAMEEADANS